ncbi:hypothetical protein HHI36_009757 [Cryptolaemus montrouzieri]|uniref:Uncharacterized protein n=1 Tax=Cryptolaemus montrouzieri TaxID=559131 RepID=A0ABD2MGR5_9CUCU
MVISNYQKFNEFGLIVADGGAEISEDPQIDMEEAAKILLSFKQNLLVRKLCLLRTAESERRVKRYLIQCGDGFNPPLSTGEYATILLSLQQYS